MGVYHELEHMSTIICLWAARRSFPRMNAQAFRREKW